MRWVEWFAGAGGSAVGKQQAGHEAVACVEWDPSACATLRAAGFPVWEGDVREWRGSPDCDAFWSSFPCQGWSTAGARKGKDDARNGWPWTVDGIDRLKPRWFVAENVPGLRMHSRACKQGRNCTGECARAYLDGVIMPQLRERFAWAEWRELNAADFGVPQHRRRIFIVAGPRPIAWPVATHMDPKWAETLIAPVLPPWRSFGEALGLTGTLDGGRNSSANPKQEKLRSSDLPAPSVGGRGNQMVRVIDEAEAARILAGPSVIVSATEVKGRSAAPVKRNRASDGLYLATGRRRLTWQECAILQDFPVGHPFHGTKKSIYQQIGNAVPPTLARVIASAVKEADHANQ